MSEQNERKEQKRYGRRRAREIALQVAYQIDLREQEAGDALASYFEAFLLEDESESTRLYARTLIDSLEKHQAAADELLREHLLGWRPERMVAVDRCAVRLALTEGVFDKLVPLSVAISEYLELVKIFGTEDSGKFINGVLGRIVRHLGNSAPSP